MSDIGLDALPGQFYPDLSAVKTRAKPLRAKNSTAIEMAQIELAPFCIPLKRFWSNPMGNHPQQVRYCLDDHNHLLKFAHGDARFKQFTSRKIHQPEFYALLRTLAPRLTEVHDYGIGIGYHSQLLATMRSFKGMAHIFALEADSANAAQSLAEQLGSLRRLMIHGQAGLDGFKTRPSFRRAKSSLLNLPLPDLVRLDLSCDPIFLPIEVNRVIAKARPLILLHLPPQPLRRDRVLTWLYGNDYRLFSLHLIKSRPRNLVSLKFNPLNIGEILAGDSAALGRKNNWERLGLLAVAEERRRDWF
ncbi:MAG: hypothetical protein QM523_05555 [Candidatus Pacebacteria bacterium]|nr:hypothetical protein [Candidatus Paceibacterota bacterium]